MQTLLIQAYTLLTVALSLLSVANTANVSPEFKAQVETSAHKAIDFANLIIQQNLEVNPVEISATQTVKTPVQTFTPQALPSCNLTATTTYNTDLVTTKNPDGSFGLVTWQTTDSTRASLYDMPPGSSKWHSMPVTPGTGHQGGFVLTAGKLDFKMIVSNQSGSTECSAEIR